MSQNSVSYEKYLKYKIKYLQLKEELYGGGLSAADAGILFDAFDTDGNGNISVDELKANKNQGDLTLDAMANNFKNRATGKFASVDIELIKDYCRLIMGGSKNWTNTSTDNFNKKFAPGGKFANLAGNRPDFQAKLAAAALK